jgi:hypothetical protein
MSARTCMRYAQEPGLQIDQNPGHQCASQRAWKIRHAGVHLLIGAFLMSLAWLAHFSQSRNIGFYSDDQTFAVPALSWSPTDLRHFIVGQLLSYPEPQGRPLGFILGVVFAYLGDHLAGVNGMFIVGWLILSTNAILFYHLLDRCFSRPIPLLGAIAFLLFPADTTRPFLCHDHILQPALTFMLIASHLYLSGGIFRRILAYLSVALCLFTYETALLPFFAIPLLDRDRSPQWRKRFIRHIIVLLTIIALVGVSRKLGHEYRTEQANGSKGLILLEIISGSIIGPAVAAFTFVWRAITAGVHLCKVPVDIFILLSAAGVFWLIFQLSDRSSETSTDIRRAAVFGAAAIGLSYILSFTHFPPVWIEGQETSVHLAAAIGGSTLFAAGCAWILHRSKHRLIATTIIALYLGLLFISATAEQDGYVTIWQERQQFWRQVVELCPDLTDHTLIICDGQTPQPVHFVLASCWSDSLVLGQMYQMPAGFTEIPQVSCFPADSTGKGWRTWLTRDPTGRAIWSQAPYGRKLGSELVEGNTILLHMNSNGLLTRLGGAVQIAGKPFHLRTMASPGKAALDTQRFYDVLIGNSR